MAQHAGLVHILDEPKRADSIDNAVDEREKFTDAVSRSGHRAGSPALCLLSLDGNYISAACVADILVPAPRLLRLLSFVFTAMRDAAA